MSKLYPIFRTGFYNPTNNIFDLIVDSFSADYSDRTEKNKMNMPKANIVKVNSGYTIEMMVPGFSRDEFEMTVINGVLSVTLHTEDRSTVDQYHSREWSYHSFTRSWNLPERANVEGVEARYEAGILYVDVPVEGYKEVKKIIKVN